MKVLVACEESQRVCCAFRAKGHESYSCDIVECSGGHPEWHILGDVLNYLNPTRFMPPDEFVFRFGIPFCTQDGRYHEILGKWDLIIAHPPCTYLSNAGACRLYTKFGLNAARYEKGMKAKEFFLRLFNADCSKVVIENPIPMKVFGLPDHNQIIQPFEFGDPYKKRTCLWLKGVPPLRPIYSNLRSCDYPSWVMSTRNAAVRSKTFPGIANAMAEQWG